ncbi:hypothetical protein [Actinomadura xylanilytica]|uniref:hypothetical protein n=1 Tax=Actinomadura xylanilytica TaxID=887459 RepID=UPI00255ADB85|nr:hypothetical protein [Actinomadura xylanilytica]MDL4775462.1 hypothetical protein [Actinomadura xylanilytica]
MKRRVLTAGLGAAAVLGLGMAAPAGAEVGGAPASPPTCGYNDLNYVPYYLNCKDEPREVRVRDTAVGDHTICVPATAYVKIGDNVYTTTWASDTGVTCAP